MKRERSIRLSTENYGSGNQETEKDLEMIK